LHTFYSKENKIYENILPPLRLLNANEQKDLIDNLNNLDFKLNSKMAA
jgi:4-hydroxy-tetrahydrodipicolinate synthase